MRDFLKKQLSYITTDSPCDDFATDDCRWIIGDVKDLAAESGLPAVVELCLKCKPTRPAVRLLIAECLASLSPETEKAIVRDWLLVSEVALQLRVSQNKVLGWIRSGVLPSNNVNDSDRPSYRVHEDDLRKFNPAKVQTTPNRKRKRKSDDKNVDYFPDK